MNKKCDVPDYTPGPG